MKREKSKTPILKLIAIGFILAILLIISVQLYFRTLKPINELSADDKKYKQDLAYIELENNIKIISAEADSIVRYMKEYDTLNIITQDFINATTYDEYIIYGDKDLVNTQNLDYKITYLNNVLGNLNYYNDDINLFLYSMKKSSKRSDINKIMSDINYSVKEVNKMIDNYNKKYETHFVHLTLLEDCYPNTDKAYNKDLKARWKETGYSFQ